MENERVRFVIEAEISDISHAELCRRYNISRPTGYKWLRRYREEGLDGLRHRSHRPHSCPHATPDQVVDAILRIRKKRGWGARKIRVKLGGDPAIEQVPSVDTVHQVLVRHGCVEERKPRRRRTHPGPPLPIHPEPNATWTADFKGEFRTRDSKLCFPLTVQDGHSRFLLECRGMLRLDLEATVRRFRHLFREFGLPQRIRTDYVLTTESRLSAGEEHPIGVRAMGRRGLSSRSTSSMSRRLSSTSVEILLTIMNTGSASPALTVLKAA